MGKAVIGLALPLAAIFGFSSIYGIPRTVVLLHPILFFGGLAISRIVFRYLLVDILNSHRHNGEQRNVLIYGAGSSGQQLALSMRSEPSMNLMGFIDDNPNLAGQRLNEKPVFLGAKLEQVVAEQLVSDVLLAIPNASRLVQQAIIERLSKLPVKVKTLPSLSEMINGNISMNDLRAISVEDLLGRMTIKPDDTLMEQAVAGKTVVVTGAGGSIGSELCVQILKHKPLRIILAEISEVALYSIDQKLRDALIFDETAAVEIVAELVNVADREQIARLFRKWRPQIVFHSAAYKHVPLIEANPLSGIRNNIYGTLHTAVEAEAAGVEKFILISTDKAVRPTNIMGTTKRCCELILQAMAARGSDTKFSMVRFGNVLGSSGSVVPRFLQQIEAGGPVTLTDRKITRYFMTIPEASQLVIQAAGMADGGEVFLLDMGEPVRIADLAESMIHLSGRTLRTASHPDGDIEIIEVGLRPGEKLYEELLIGDNPKPSGHPKIMMASEHYLKWDELKKHIDELDTHLISGLAEPALIILKKLVPEFNHMIHERVSEN
ncbi:polysaccharide biosynthesis protein [Sphingorhabdus arenilitoris]|uniref:polysaccharide biosynthesis protein n=1 Tax=Sphingorhabdus arenilitoris TaxID=1490041 RepID=UPI0036D30C11